MLFYIILLSLSALTVSSMPELTSESVKTPKSYLRSETDLALERVVSSVISAMKFLYKDLFFEFFTSDEGRSN